MSLDHDIPTHLDVADRPALGLTAPQLLVLVSGLLAGLNSLHQAHLPLLLRLVESITPPALALALVFVRPAGRSLVAWGRVALRHLTGPRAFTGGLPGRHRPCAASRRRPATQDHAFVPQDIADDTVTFRDGRRCAVLECSGISTQLMDEETMRATHAAYHAVLVGLPWPLQIVAWASPVDLSTYVMARERRLAVLPPDLREVESSDVAFMRREARRLGLLDQRLFVVIPAPERAGRTVPTPTLLAAARARVGATLPASDNAVAGELDDRCERVRTDLASAGVHSWRLPTDGLRVLWYRLLAPRSASLQPFDPGHAAPIIWPEIEFSQAGQPAEEDRDA